MLKDYGAKPVEEQHSIRGFSGILIVIFPPVQSLTVSLETEPESIALAVLSGTTHLGDLNEAQQKLALEYLGIQLAIRDREQLIKVLCHSSPDLLTSSIRTIIPPYNPIIRALHNAADLSGGVSDFEAFLNDLIKVSTVENKAGANGVTKPSVEDYCRLLQKHQGSSHKFIHQVLKNDKELSQRYHEYAAHAAKQYKQETELEIENEEIGMAAAGDMTQRLSDLLSSLPSETDKTPLLEEINAHSRYLASLSRSSTNSMKTIIRNLSDGKSETSKGPGMFLSRWQSLMDETPITPATAGGPVRSEKSASVRDATAVDTDGERKGDVTNIDGVDGEVPDPPDVGNVIRLLAPGFKDVLRDEVERRSAKG